MLQGLTDLGYEVVSTGGSAKALEAEGIPVQRVEQLTGYPEMLDGRVSLHAVLQPQSRGGVQLRDVGGFDVKRDRDKLPAWCIGDYILLLRILSCSRKQPQWATSGQTSSQAWHSAGTRSLLLPASRQGEDAAPSSARRHSGTAGHPRAHVCPATAQHWDH